MDPLMPSLTKKLDLPSGGWVEMRDPNYLRGKDRDALIRKLEGPGGEGLEKIDAGLRTVKILAGIMIKAWSLPYEPDDIDDGQPRPWTLPGEDWTIMAELLAGDVAVIEDELKAAQSVLMPGKPSPAQHADPESPSGPESA